MAAPEKAGTRVSSWLSHSHSKRVFLLRAVADVILWRSCCEMRGFQRTPLGGVTLALLCLLVSGVLLSGKEQDLYLFRASLLPPGSFA